MIRTLFVPVAVGAAIIGAAPAAGADAPYANCTEAARDGRVNIPSSDPSYGPWLDRDNDGIGCES